MFDLEISKDFFSGLLSPGVDEKFRVVLGMFSACYESVTGIPAPEVVMEFQHVSETRIEVVLLV